MTHHMVVRKIRAPKKNDKRPKVKVSEPIMVPKSGRPSETYRGPRKNFFHEVEENGIVVRRRSPEYQSLADYQKQYQLKHPELIRRISNKGEVHYVTATRDEA